VRGIFFCVDFTLLFFMNQAFAFQLNIVASHSCTFVHHAAMKKVQYITNRTRVRRNTASYMHNCLVQKITYITNQIT